MGSRILHQRPLLTVPQMLVLLAVIAALFIALDLNRRAQAGQLVGVGEEALLNEVVIETTRQVELQATLTYVKSDDYVEAYARDEGGLIRPGERRVVPLVIEVTASPIPDAIATPDPAADARAWQAWWQLLTDDRLPSR